MDVMDNEHIHYIHTAHNDLHKIKAISPGDFEQAEQSYAAQHRDTHD